ncbi:ammonium transporter [Hyphomicrobium facile]|uniref:Ammonium transporter n=1 Tax=Hyphomicrobium facile TaxID=51670 RepID=A0A1I7NBY6_9HYPH|nr:ammonium transporter [Hyphomicrobium facile]SFV32162.1 ammonium transporter [Hyphomicrobium facile]
MTSRLRPSLGATALSAVTLLATSAIALAQEAAPAAAEPAAAAAPAFNNGDIAWMLTSSVLVLMMLVPGLGLFYAGMVRKKNALAVLMQCVFGAGLLSIVWVVVGYSIAFTEGSPFFGGFSKVLLAGIAPDTPAPAASGIPEFLFVMFQMTFFIITPIIALGGPADRMKFSASMAFVTLWAIFAYAPIAHMVWGPGGYLGGAGVLDYAGGTVVHINSAIAGLVAAIIVGRRKGYGTEQMAPHNLVLTMIGGSLLWCGWFGFNVGSALGAGASTGIIMLNTQIATAGAVVSWTLVEWIIKGKPSLLGAVSGAIAGLVAITPACGFVAVDGALIIGLAAGVLCYWGVTGLKRALGYDDALDVFGVHGIGGILGAVLTGVFAVQAVGGEGKSGWIEGNLGQVWVQIEGIGLTIVWSAVVSLVALLLIKFTIGLRVNEAEEAEGLDLALHGETFHD